MQNFYLYLSIFGSGLKGVRKWNLTLLILFARTRVRDKKIKETKTPSALRLFLLYVKYP